MAESKTILSEKRALQVLQWPQFGNPQHIQAVKILRAASEIEEAIRACPHYHEWEWSPEPCCARMSYLSGVYPDLFTAKMNALHGTTGKWA